MNTLAETASSFDEKTPNVLLQRYNSYSTSSESNRSSLASSISSGLSFQRRSDRTVQRRNNAVNNIIKKDEGTRSNIQSDNGKNTDSEMQQPDDNNDNCFLCSSMVNERQYYMWQSDYTKSSFCSRCIGDSNALKYISYWGTSCYKTGSWRERYKDGRSSDIDLTPLLEVLDRIDMIDTSICGYTSKRKHTTTKSAKNTTRKYVETCPKVDDLEDVDYYLSERRKRRLRNREAMAHSDIVANGSNRKRCPKEKENTNFNHKANNSLTSLTGDICKMAIERFEQSNSDDVEDIEPLAIQQADETINQCETLASYRHSQSFNRSKGHTTYEDFIAGLRDDSKMTRKSTGPCDLVTMEEVSNNHDKVYPKRMSEVTNTYDNCQTERDIVLNKSIYKGNSDSVGNMLPESSKATELPVYNCTVAKKSKQNVDAVLGYKRKTSKTKQLNTDNRRVRKSYRHNVDFKELENLKDKDENMNGEEFTFSEIKHKSDIMQSNDNTNCKQTALGSDTISLGEIRSQYIKGKGSNRCNGATEKELSESNRNRRTTVDETDTIKCYASEKAKYTIRIKPNLTETKTTSQDDHSHEIMNDTLASFVHDNNNIVNINLQDENKQQNIQYVDRNHRNNLAFRQTNLLRQDSVTIQSESSTEESDDETNTSLTYDNDDELDIITSISNTETTSQSSNASAQADNYETHNDLEEMKEYQHELRDRRRPIYRRSMQHTQYEHKSEAYDVTSDVPHIERIKKKLGRLRSEEDDAPEEINNYMELDVSDNEQMELSWRTRGYNADFFMSRQSVTGSEIIDRYNRAITRRRIRKRAKATPYNHGVLTDLDTIKTHSADVSRKQSVCPKKHVSSAPLTRQTTIKRDSIQSIGSGPISNSNVGVSPMALTEALTRATNCSKRFSRRLRSQLDYSSCDSSS